MPTLRTRNPAPTVVTDDIPLPPTVPELPDDVLKRFPSLSQWEEDVNAWWTKAQNALQTNQHVVSQSVTKSNKQVGDIFVSINGLTASVTTQIAALVTADAAMAQRIVTVSAIAGVSQNIKIQNTAPVGPAVNDYWIDNTDLTQPVTYQWSGAAWVEVTTPISAAAVAAEQTARVTADGFLSGKYTLTVAAGNVVTGMNITSSSGGGTNVSDVTFVAANFKIYNGTTGVTMFNVSGATVQLAGTLTVSTSGKVFIGAGNYGNTDTAWYVDSTGQFSLKDKLTWDGTTLAITGSLTATVGTIGGWTLAATTLSANNAVLDSAGQLALGTGNDIAIISSTNATYRVWIGNAAAGSAAFSVTKAGAMSATAGSIGGWTINTTYLAKDTGTDATSVGMSPSDYPFYAGATYANRATAPFRVTPAGALVASGAIISGGTLDVGSGQGHFYVDATNFYYGETTGRRFNFGNNSYGQILAMYNAANKLVFSLDDGGGNGGEIFLNRSDGHASVVAFADADPGVYLYDNGNNLALRLQISTGLLFYADTNLYRASANILKTDDAFVAVGNITANGFVCRAGSGGATSNLFNFYWVGSDLQAWIDASNIGLVCFRGAYSAGLLVQSGYVEMVDSGGTTRKFLVGT